MSDCDKLVEALRYCGNFTEREGCAESCEYFNDIDCPNRIMSDAAAAIEALQAQLPKQGEIVRCGECKHHLPETERTNPYCNRFHCMKPDDWFCADGVREVQE